jgi:23S rRNA (uracil1939-C5)-methyltransferase
VRPGDLLELELDALDPSGDGVGAVDDVAVHVPGALPGERAAVRVAHRSRQHPRAHAGLRALLRPHPARRDPPCPHHGHAAPACTGCPLLPLGVAAQRAAKRDLLARLYGLAVAEVVGDERELGYRWSSKRVVGGRPGALVFGSYARGSHVVAAMHACRVDHPRIVEVLDELRAAADALAVVPYDEASGAGDLRYLWLKTDGHDVLLTLVTAGDDSLAARELPARLRRPAGVAWSVQPGRGNALRGRPPEVLAGRGALAPTLAGVSVAVGPLGFLQPNPPVAARAYLDLVAGPDDAPLRGALALDLYAGAGVTTELLRRSFVEVRACEAYPESAARLGLAPETAEAFLARALADAAAPDLVVANPPREGLGPQVCADLVRLAAPRVHLMSCGPAGLARDLAALAPAYRLADLRAYDTLPQTPHVELVARLERA